MNRKSAKAFTLVELLVVIGIIGLLISILLPALNKARAAANTIKCSANLRSIGQAMQLYASQYKGFIPGSGDTSGSGFFTKGGTAWSAGAITVAAIPSGSPIHPLDWMRPIIDAMGTKVPNAADNDLTPVSRFQFYMKLQEFICPANVDVTCFKVPAVTSNDAGTVQAPSYVTAVLNILGAQDIAGYGSASRVTPTQKAFPVMPSKYIPSLGSIPNSSEKIFMADGCKYVNSSFNNEITPEYDLSLSYATYTAPNNAGYSCPWTDFGSWAIIGGAWDRAFAPGNVHTGSNDPRPLVFRHGGFRNGQFRANALFFDGHVESMDEMTFSQPKLWMPSGASWGPTAPAGFTGLGTGVFAEIWPDVISRFNITATYVVP